MFFRHLMTPVMYAAKQGFAKLVKVLCENDADINKQETRGWTVRYLFMFSIQQNIS